jgi:hypothetical protein
LRRLKSLRKVGASREDLQPRIAGTQVLCGTQQRFPRDVDRDIRGRQPQVIQQDARLQTAAAAELDQADIIADAARHLRGVAGREIEFRPRHVVFLKLADLFEQLRAPLVVEVLRLQGLRRGQQAGQHLFAHEAGRPGMIVKSVEDADTFRRAVEHHASSARRRPVNCQRWWG